ncbi:MAG: hypothetical protein AAFX87_01265 [Bacteroidota bacterium]
MKRIFLLSAITLIASFSLKAQDLTPPKDGAVIRMAEHKFEVKAGKSQTADVWIVKSKRYRKVTFEGLKTRAPEGIEVSFVPVNAEEGKFKMNISVSSAAAPGKHMLILKGDGKNAYKLKSTTFSIAVGGKAIAEGSEK